mgnify:CR=1 FL=1
MILEGKIWIFGDNVDTDAIIPARYLTTTDPEELAKHCMEDADAEFAGKVQPGDIIVGGKNFGCGSSREHAPIAIKGARVSCVLAESFARIFYRNAINIGLPILECDEDLTAVMKSGDKVQVDLEKGSVLHLNSGHVFQAAPFPPFMQEIIRLGGLVEYVRHKKDS